MSIPVSVVTRSIRTGIFAGVMCLVFSFVMPMGALATGGGEGGGGGGSDDIFDNIRKNQNLWPKRSGRNRNWARPRKKIRRTRPVRVRRKKAAPRKYRWGTRPRPVRPPVVWGQPPSSGQPARDDRTAPWENARPGALDDPFNPAGNIFDTPYPQGGLAPAANPPAINPNKPAMSVTTPFTLPSPPPGPNPNKPAISVTTPFSLPPQPAGPPSKGGTVIGTMVEMVSTYVGPLCDGLPGALEKMQGTRFTPSSWVDAGKMRTLVNGVRRSSAIENMISNAGNFISVGVLGWSASDMSMANNANEYSTGADNYGRTAAQAVGGTIGAAGGVAVGGFIGSWAGGIGALIGAPIGGVAGAVGGGYTGGQVYDAALSTGVKDVAADYYTDHLSAYSPHQALRDKLNEGR